MKWQLVRVPDSSQEERVVVHFLCSFFLEESLQP